MDAFVVCLSLTRFDRTEFVLFRYIKDAIRARNKNVAFLASFTNPDVIFEQVRFYAFIRMCGSIGWVWDADVPGMTC